MWAEVTPLRQDGKINPRWKWGVDLRMGRLQVTEQHDRAVRRSVRVATLSTHDCIELMTPLRDVVLLHLEASYMVLAGYQHSYLIGASEPALLGQTWAVHQITETHYREWHARQAAEGRLPKRPVAEAAPPEAYG